MTLENKKGMELSFQAIVMLIIIILVLIVVIAFFVSQYGDGSGSLIDIGQGAIDSARNSS